MTLFNYLTLRKRGAVSSGKPVERGQNHNKDYASYVQ